MIDATPERKQAVDFPEVAAALLFARRAGARRPRREGVGRSQQARRAHRRAAGHVRWTVPSPSTRPRPTSSASPTMPRRSPPSRSGRVDAVCLFHPPLLAARQRLGKGKIVVPTPAAVAGLERGACARSDTAFVAWVDKQLAEFYKSGQTQKWYEAVRSATSASTPRLAPPVMKEMIGKSAAALARPGAPYARLGLHPGLRQRRPAGAGPLEHAQGHRRGARLRPACSGLVLALMRLSPPRLAVAGRPASSSRCSAPRRRWCSCSGSSSPCR